MGRLGSLDGGLGGQKYPHYGNMRLYGIVRLSDVTTGVRG